MDRALVEGGGQGEADGHRRDARLEGGRSGDEERVEGGEIRHAEERPGVGSGVLEEEEDARLIGYVLRGPVEEPNMVNERRLVQHAGHRDEPPR